MSQCPECQEKRRVTITVGARSERRPKPVYRFYCKSCGHSWIRDENTDAETDG